MRFCIFNKLTVNADDPIARVQTLSSKDLGHPLSMSLKTRKAVEVSFYSTAKHFNQQCPPRPTGAQHYHTQLSASQLDLTCLSVNQYNLFLRSCTSSFFLSPWFLQFRFKIDNIKIIIIIKTSLIPALPACDFFYSIYWNSILLIKKATHFSSEMCASDALPKRCYHYHVLYFLDLPFSFFKLLL